MPVEPVKDVTDAPPGEGDTGIGGAVIEVDAVAVLVQGVAARECDVADVPDSLVRHFRSEDPGIASPQAVFSGLEIEERGAEPDAMFGAAKAAL